MLTAETSPIIIGLALIGLAVGARRIRAIRATWRDSSRPARRLRIRYAVLGLSVVGMVLVTLTQLGAPFWVAKAGFVLIFGGWGAFLLLSIVFGFLEGFRGE